MFNLPWLKKIIWVIGVLRGTVVSDWRFDNLCGSHLQSQVTLKMASAQVVETSVTNNSSVFTGLQSTRWSFSIKVNWTPSSDSEDGFRTGCRNVSHKQQFFTGLQSTRWSFSIKVCYSWVQTIFLFWCSICNLFVKWFSLLSYLFSGAPSKRSLVLICQYQAGHKYVLDRSVSTNK